MPLIKIVVLDDLTTMEKGQCYLISTTRRKAAIKGKNPKIEAGYCNTVRNIYITFSKILNHFENYIHLICYNLTLLNKQIDGEKEHLRKCTFSSNGKNKRIKIKVCTSELFDPCSFSDPSPAFDDMYRSKIENGNYEVYGHE